jgi:hypothetical protein
MVLANQTSLGDEAKTCTRRQPGMALLLELYGMAANS